MCWWDASSQGVRPARWCNDKAVTWESSNASVATVDSDGTVTAVSAGTAIITVTAGDKSASCAVTVSYAALAFESGEPFAISLDTSAFSGSGVSMEGKLEWSTDYSEWKQLEADGEVKSGEASGRHVLFCVARATRVSLEIST